MLVSLHSFTPVYAGIARPWHVGTLYHRDTRLPPLLLKLLRAEPDLVVGDNEPYAVSDETDYTIPVHGETRGLMNSGIEIRQDLIAGPAGQSEWAERLARILGEIETRCAQRLLQPTPHLQPLLLWRERFVRAERYRHSRACYLTAPASAPARCRRRS